MNWLRLISFVVLVQSLRAMAVENFLAAVFFSFILKERLYTRAFDNASD
jgi:hypothetical protein